MDYIVEYSKNFPKNERFDGVVEYLKDSYKDIHIFAYDWFNSYFYSSTDIPVIPVVISSEKPQPQKYPGFNGREKAEAIVRCLDKCYRNCDLEEKIRIVEKLDHPSIFTDKILGRYHSSGYGKKNCFGFEWECHNEREERNKGPKRTISRPYIEIFLENFNYKNEDVRVQLANCLAHEYFHFIHNWVVGCGFSKRGRKTFKENAVKEALADYFALAFTLKRASKDDIQFAQERFDLWVKRFGTTWPYAYALCIFYKDDEKPLPFSEYGPDYTNGNRKDKFMHVLYESKRSMQDAFELLW